MKNEKLSQNIPSSPSMTASEMELIVGGAYCLQGKTYGVATGFCIVGSFLNPGVAVGCALWGTYHYFNC